MEIHQKIEQFSAVLILLTLLSLADTLDEVDLLIYPQLVGELNMPSKMPLILSMFVLEKPFDPRKFILDIPCHLIYNARVLYRDELYQPKYHRHKSQRML